MNKKTRKIDRTIERIIRRFCRVPFTVLMLGLEGVAMHEIESRARPRGVKTRSSRLLKAFSYLLEEQIKGVDARSRVDYQEQTSDTEKDNLEKAGLSGLEASESNREIIMQKEIMFEANLELQRAISYLEEIASSLKYGKVVIEKAGDFIVLEPTYLVQMKLEAEAKEEGEEITFKLNWEKPIEYDFKISSVVPAVEPEAEE